MCLYSQEYIWDSDEKNIIDWGSWEKCDHCKKQYELCLNFNSENSFSSWVDTMDFFLKWDKQQDLDDENQKNNSQHGILINKYTLQQRSIIFGMLQGEKWVSMKNQIHPKFETRRWYSAPEFD